GPPKQLSTHRIIANWDGLRRVSKPNAFWPRTGDHSGKLSKSSAMIEATNYGKAKEARSDRSRRNPGRRIHETASHQPEPACPRHRREPTTNQRHCPRAFRHHRLD